MLRKIFLVVAGLLASTSGMQAQWVQIPQVSDAPFQAVSTVTITDSKGTHKVAGKVARNKVGSSYVEIWNVNTNQLSDILIVDVPGKRAIHLGVVKKFYSVDETPMLAAHALAPGSASDKISHSLANLPSHREAGGVTEDIQSLGTKDIEGVLTLGVLQTKKKSGTETVVSTVERWSSPDLEIALVTKTHDPAKGTDQVKTLSGLQRTEPDPALFAIPAGYIRDPANAKGPPAQGAVGSTSPK